MCRCRLSVINYQIKMKFYLKLPAQRAWLISTIPLLISISSYLFAKATCFLNSASTKDRILQGLDSVALFNKVQDASIQVYSTYLYFLAVMLLLDSGSAVISGGSRSLYPKLKELLQSTRNSLKKDSLSKDSQTLNGTPSTPEALQTQLRPVGISIFETVLTYSIIYFSYVLILSIVPCMIHGLSVILHRNTYLSVDRSSNQYGGPTVSEHISQKISHLPVLEKSNNKSVRILSPQDKNDVVNVLASLTIEQPDYVFTSGEQEMLVFKDGNGSRIDLSDPSASKYSNSDHQSKLYRTHLSSYCACISRCPGYCC